MRKQKKLISLLLAGLLALNAVGCSAVTDSETKDSDTSAKSSEKKDDGEKKKKAKEKPEAKDDFYDHVNFDSLKELEIPYGDSEASAFSSDEAEEQTKAIIKRLGESTEKFAPGSNEQLVHDAYQQFLSYKEDSRVEKIIMGNCDRILATKDMNELLELWGELVRDYGAMPLLKFEVKRDYVDGTRYSLYLDQFDGFLGCSMKEIKEETKNVSEANDIARDMLRVMGDDYETADEKGRQMAYLGINIADATNVDLKLNFELILNIERTSFSDLKKIMSNVDGSVVEMFYGDAEDLTDGVYIFDVEQLKRINELITDENFEKWQTYLLSSYLDGMGEYVRETNSILADYNPVSKRAEDEQAFGYVRGILGKRISELYAQEYYTPELDKGVHELFDEIIASYDDLMTKAEWLSPEARELLKVKLHNINLITTPVMHEVDKKDAELIGDTKYDTVLNFRSDSRSNDIKKLPTKVDKNVPDMLSLDYNAQYLPCNAINITVAIMQKPMFDVNGDHAENLGGLGTVVGHEIGHAFDSDLIKFNAEGKYDPKWLPEADMKVLTERADALVDYYSNYTIMEVYHIDGKQTSGENYADIGGMECVTNILDDKAELDRMFRRYAETWSTLMVDSEGIELLLTDEHSPSKARVNAVLSSNKKFNEVYGLKEGDGMYVAPEERVSRW